MHAHAHAHTWSLNQYNVHIPYLPK